MALAMECSRALDFISGLWGLILLPVANHDAAPRAHPWVVTLRFQMSQNVLVSYPKLDNIVQYPQGGKRME